MSARTRPPTKAEAAEAMRLLDERIATQTPLEQNRAVDILARRLDMLKTQDVWLSRVLVLSYIPVMATSPSKNEFFYPATLVFLGLHFVLYRREKSRDDEIDRINACIVAFGDPVREKDRLLLAQTDYGNAALRMMSMSPIEPEERWIRDYLTVRSHIRKEGLQLKVFSLTFFAVFFILSVAASVLLEHLRDAHPSTFTSLGSELNLTNLPFALSALAIVVASWSAVLIRHLITKPSSKRTPPPQEVFQHAIAPFEGIANEYLRAHRVPK